MKAETYVEMKVIGTSEKGWIRILQPKFGM
jgi:hypothetical protein